MRQRPTTQKTASSTRKTPAKKATPSKKVAAKKKTPTRKTTAAKKTAAVTKKAPAKKKTVTRKKVAVQSTTPLRSVAPPTKHISTTQQQISEPPPPLEQIADTKEDCGCNDDPNCACCLQLCISVYVGLSSKTSGTPLIKPKDIKKMQKTVGEIWGCKKRAKSKKEKKKQAYRDDKRQCCIKINFKHIVTALKPDLPDKVALTGKGAKKDKAAIAELYPESDKQCYRIYIVKKTTGETKSKTRLVGFTDRDNQTIILEKTSAEKLGVRLAHELGHALGLDHVDGPVMNLMRHKYKSTSRKLTADQCAMARKSPLLKNTKKDCEQFPAKAV